MSQHTELRLELTKNLKWNGLLGVWLIKHHELIGLIERAADALQALERVPTTYEWTSVADRLPELQETVLLTCTANHGTPGEKPFVLPGYLSKAPCDYCGAVWSSVNLWGAELKVTYWMPLPTPPESK